MDDGDSLFPRFLGGVQNVLRDSTTYQKILRDERAEGVAEGRIDEARRMLFRLGVKRFGTPNAAVFATLASIDDVDRLEEVIERILDADVRDWDDLTGIS